MCGRRKKRGGICRRETNADGACYYHGQGGGRPPQTHMYARDLGADEFELDDFRQAAVDGLDDEIRVAKTKLAWTLRQHRADPTGGVQTGAGKMIRWTPWVAVVEQYIDLVRKLVLARASLLKQEPEEDDDIKAYEEWVASQRASSPSEPSRPSPSPPSSPEAA